MSNKFKQQNHNNKHASENIKEREITVMDNNTVVSNDKTKQDTQSTNNTAENQIDEKEKSSIDDDFIDILHLDDYVEGTRYPIKELEKAKQEYKKVYHTYYMGYHFIWHRINRANFTKILDSFVDIEDVKERAHKRMLAICDKCVLYPYAERFKELIDNGDIIPRGLADEILDRSGFVPAATKEL